MKLFVESDPRYSGHWEFTSTQYGQPEAPPQLWTATLWFLEAFRFPGPPDAAVGLIYGDGADDVGQFRLHGVYLSSESRFIAEKRYRSHKVTYTGRLEQHDADGNWFILVIPDNASSSTWIEAFNHGTFRASKRKDLDAVEMPLTPISSPGQSFAEAGMLDLACLLDGSAWPTAASSIVLMPEIRRKAAMSGDIGDVPS